MTGSETFALDIHASRHQPGGPDDIWVGLSSGQKAAIIAALGLGGGGSVPDATTTIKGILQLAGDLAGTAAAPTVPGLTGKAPLASPTFTGTPAAPTPTAGDNSTKISTTAFVQAAIAALVNSSPSALDTLKELADALGDDANFATTMTNALAGKMPVLTATTVKTTTYTAAAGEMVPCDASSAAFTVTLPTAPADKTRIIVKKIDASLNAVTLARGGSSDVFNKAAGSTSIALSWQFSSITVQYVAATGVWLVVSSDIGSDPRLARAGNFDAPSGGIVLPLGLVTVGTVALVSGSTGLGSWAPVDLVPGKSYDALVTPVVTTAQVGGTTTTTLALYADKNGLPDVASGPVASGTVTLTAIGNRIAVLGTPFLATATRYWGALLYVETAAPAPRATLGTISVGLCVSHDGSSTIGANSWRGWSASGLSAMPSSAVTLTGASTPYLVGVRAA